MSLALIHQMKEFRAEIRKDIEKVRAGAHIDAELDALKARLKELENKYMALNARMGKRDG